MKLPRLSKIDDLTRQYHSHLEEDDQCYFFGEYTSREGFSYSNTNNLIINFKKPMTRKGKSDWPYKERAISEVANTFEKSLPEELLTSMTLVPVPPSKAKDHPEHDDRMLRVLQKIRRGRNLDIRELILQHESAKAAHESDERPTRKDLIDNYRVDESIAQPPPQKIALFDDVLTNGTHFKAAQTVLQNRFPGVSVVGIFIARRAITRNEFDDDYVDSLLSP